MFALTRTALIPLKRHPSSRVTIDLCIRSLAVKDTLDPTLVFANRVLSIAQAVFSRSARNSGPVAVS